MNHIRARVEVSFKGENHEVEAEIDLDAIPVEEVEAPDFHLILARAAGIDPYSYLYEVLAAEDIRFFDASGIATVCCHEGRFNWLCFLGARSKQRHMQLLGEIARVHLGLSDLAAHPEIEKALLAAYQAGRSNGS